MAEQAMTNETVISFWGPQRAGKTSLIHALARQLQIFAGEYEMYKAQLDDFHRTLTEYQEGLKQDGVNPEELLEEIRRLNNLIKNIEYQYALTNAEGMPFEPMAPADILQTPLGYGEQEVFLFERRARDSVPSPSREISSHFHRLTLRDFAGEDFVPESEAAAAKAGVTRATNALKAAPYIIIVLDHTSNLPVGKYVQSVRDLIKRYRSSHQFIVCVTKIDQWPDKNARFSTTWDVITNHYSEKFAQELRNLPLVGKRSNPAAGAFLVSAAGYKSDGRTPNIGPGASGKVEMRERDNWYPFNVEYPFFAIMEDVERMRLARGPLGKIVSRQAHYVGYARPEDGHKTHKP